MPVVVSRYIDDVGAWRRENDIRHAARAIAVVANDRIQLDKTAISVTTRDSHIQLVATDSSWNAIFISSLLFFEKKRKEHESNHTKQQERNSFFFYVNDESSRHTNRCTNETGASGVRLGGAERSRHIEPDDIDGDDVADELAVGEHRDHVLAFDARHERDARRRVAQRRFVAQCHIVEWTTQKTRH